MARSVLYMRPDGTPVYASSVVREEKAAARTKKARQKPIVKRRKAIASGTAPAVARAQTPLRPAPSSRPAPKRQKIDPAAAAFLREVDDYERDKKSGRVGQPSREVQTGGLPDRLQLLRNDSPETGLGGFFANAGSNVLDIATGLPSTAQIVGRNFAAFSPVVGPLRFVPGLDAVDRFQDRVAGEDKQFGRSVAADYSKRWGPLFRGDVDEFWHQVYENPVFMASDVAGATSAAGALVRSGAKAGAAISGSQRLARVASKAITPGSPRYRPPKVREMAMGENSESVSRIATSRRPYTANPITRPIQRGAGKLRERVARSVEERVDRGSQVLAPFGREAKFNRMTTRAARDYRLAADMEAHKSLRIGTRDYVQAVHELERSGVRDMARRGLQSKYTHEQIDAALYVHARDLVRVPGKTPREALNDVASFWRENQVKNPRRKNKGAQLNAEILESLPDELLDLKGNAALRRAVDEYKKVSEAATNMRVKAGTITPQTAIEVKARPALSAHQGVVFDHKSGKWTSPRNPYAGVGTKGVYTPDIARDPLKKGRAGDPSGAYGRMTQDKVRQSHGTLFSTGNVRMDRGLPIKALERALVDEKHPKFVEDFYKTFAFREKNAKLTTGNRARLAMEADPDNVVLMSRKSLDDAMRLNRELPEGQMPDSPLRGVEIYEGREGLARAKELGDKADDLVAFPRAAVEGMREGWNKIKGGQIPGFDTGQTLWKRGILAYAPRYYMNSLLGNTIQYGMLTGGDLRSLFQARHKKLGNAVPERISASTNVAEARIGDPRWASMTLPGKKLAAFSDRLMGFQASFDALFRRAAYINRVKRGLKAEGRKIRGLSPEDMGEAIRTAPKDLQAQAMRETELFLGDYLRLSPLERATLRRIFPFYSFMRFIGRFMFEMPIRHPKRAAIIALVNKASADVVNPLDEAQDNLANRGRLMAGGFAQRTTGWNSLFPNADLIRAITSGDVQGVAGNLADNTSPIGLQQFLRNYSGTGAFGVPVSAPPGYGDSYQTFGGPLMRDDPATGRPSYYSPTIPLSEQLLQTFPLVPQVIRGIASGPDRAYDVTTTPDILMYRLGQGGDRNKLFRPRRDRAMEPVPYLGPVLGWAGINLQRYDREEDLKAIERSNRYARDAKRQTSRRRKKLKIKP